MVNVKTERLKLIPLDSTYLKLLIEDQSGLETVLGLNRSSSQLDLELAEAMQFRLSKVLSDQENYIWYTNWLIIHQKQNCCVGGVMLKGLPNESGEVIIGYYTNPEHQGNGYMTEAITNLTSWLLSQPQVSSVVADTAKDNIPSHRVLEKAGARRYKESEELYYWKITR